MRAGFGCGVFTCNGDACVLQTWQISENYCAPLQWMRQVQGALRECTQQPSGMDFFGTKCFPMRPGGTSVSWHQDNHYFGTSSSQIVSCAVYLEDTDRANGSLRVIPGSHLEGEVPHCPGVGEWANGEWAVVDERRAIDVVCCPGTVVLFNALLLHAAHKNTSDDRTRYIMCARV